MPNITIERAGELSRSVFEILWNHPAGLKAQDVLTQIPRIAKLTEEEKSPAPNSASPRYEKIVRIAVIPLAQAGWLTKDGQGLWRITREGYDAGSQFTNAREFYKEALRLYDQRRSAIPENIMTLEAAQEISWAQIKKYLHRLSSHDMLSMLAGLLRAMDYHPAWMAPQEKQRGRIDLVAYTDPLGVKGPRILVQIKHKGQAVTLEGVKSFLSILNSNDYGMILSVAGFTNEAGQELGNFQKLTALDAAAFFKLWETYYDQLDEDVRRLLPLKAVYFLALTE